MGTAAVALKASSVAVEINEREASRKARAPEEATIATPDLSRRQLIENIRTNIMAWTRWTPANSHRQSVISNQ